MFHVMRVDRDQCVALSGAKVDFWQCDLNGSYSGFENQGEDLLEQNFPRGYPLTASIGYDQFITIFPEWYHGRIIHLHVKISTETLRGKRYEFSTQLYSDDDLLDHIYSMPSYHRLPKRCIRNLSDWVFCRSGGEQLVLDVSPTDSRYMAMFLIGLHFSEGNRTVFISMIAQLNLLVSSRILLNERGNPSQ